MKINVHIHIERLILEGLPLRTLQGLQVQAAVEKELGRLLALGGIPDELQVGGAVPRLRAPALELAKETQPTLLGQQIARSVYRGIGNAR